MPKPTDSEIDAEIKALEACKSYIPTHNLFGDDNHAGLDSAIEALRERLDVDEAYDRVESEDGDISSNEQLVIDAALWLAGERKASLSSDWDSCKPKAE
jgi:hypothetical protein